MLQPLIVPSLQISGKRCFGKFKSKIFENKRSKKCVWTGPGRQLENTNAWCHIKSVLINCPIIQTVQGTTLEPNLSDQIKPELCGS